MPQRIAKECPKVSQDFYGLSVSDPTTLSDPFGSKANPARAMLIAILRNEVLSTAQKNSENLRVSRRAPSRLLRQFCLRLIFTTYVATAEPLTPGYPTNTGFSSAFLTFFEIGRDRVQFQ